MARGSSQYLWADVRSNVSALMKEHSETQSNGPSKYWYPLARPSYGVEEVLGALESMVSFRTSMWNKTADFEQAFGDRFGGEAVMVNSGSSADLLIAFSLRVESGGPLNVGDEILVPSVTWPTQIWALMMAGFVVRLVDTDVETLNMNLGDLAKKVGPKTRAISVVHLMGNPMNMDVICKLAEDNSLLILEDACESLGSSWAGKNAGTFGWAGAFSFFFSHHLVTMEGGMILTANRDVAEQLRLLRAHGWSRNLKNPPVFDDVDSRYAFTGWGMNVRPTELQAAFGQVQLERWDLYERVRAENAAVFEQEIADLEEHVYSMKVSEKAKCNWFALPIIVREGSPVTRNQLVVDLERAGIETRPIVAGNIARQPVAQKFPALGADTLPGADFLHDNGLYLGLHPSEESGVINRVVQEVARSVAKQVEGKLK